MKKFIYIAASLFLTMTMQAQDRPQPKAGPAPTIEIFIENLRKSLNYIY